MVNWLKICDLSALPEDSSRGFCISTSAGLADIFLVRKSGEVRGYLNQCPHTGGPLDWVPDQFLDLDRRLIQCATHDALFRIDDGVCVAGPCAGQSLVAIDLKQEGNDVCMRDVVSEK
ncbi:nitrite reductase/ring-hydroxylating ferredoxin subunit [Thiogranum longum]|uniref:Nitrite reductase/ring-hydroxylating ferredoxin subunit n=1 Tax=Thiogranum longum TaxID=1537524 RepID=A0A4R1H9K6_9GAMM|nr:Rieske (2Fe-2S) protein [Thiogranum longum]TCK17191.1 nitrite reductase/ring-hydroxylating ferredoxin subunit [Thiogranum longum]